MVGSRLNLVRRFWCITSARFMRDVAASVLATALATAGLSLAMHEPAPQPSVHAGKFDERLAWQVEDVPTRDTRIYDTVAMFALPQAEPQAWSVAQAAGKVAEAAPLEVARSRSAAAAPPIVQAEATRHRAPFDAILPPHRPILLARAESPAPIPPATPRSDGSMRLLGWNVPGSDLLPSRRQALQQVAALGDSALSIGGDVADSLARGVGLR